MNRDFTSLSQVRNRSLGEHVYEEIRERIVTLEFAPGMMIYENELAAAMEVSRTPIREAIRLLVSEQLLEVLPQRGTRIALISEQKVKEARFVRLQLEQGAMRMAAAQWNNEQHDRVKERLLLLLDQQASASAAVDHVRFMQLDEAFHLELLALSGNETLLQMIAQMRVHMNRVRLLALYQDQHMEQLIDEHRLILQAIESRQEEQVSLLLSQHIGELDEVMHVLRKDNPTYFSKI